MKIKNIKIYLAAAVMGLVSTFCRLQYTRRFSK